MSQPKWGIDEAATAENRGSTVSGAVYNTYCANGFPGYSADFVWVKIKSSQNFTEGEHTISYAPEISTLFAGRLLAAIDTVRIVPASWKWVPDETLSEPYRIEWLNLEAENASYADVYNLRDDALASSGKYIEVSGESYTSETSAAIDWSFDISETKKYDIWALMSAFYNRTSVSQPKWGIDEAATAENRGSTVSGAVYNTLCANGFPGYTSDFVWVKIKGAYELSEGAHTIQYVPEISALFDGRLLAAIDTVRIVPADWNWVPGDNKDFPTMSPWVNIEAEACTDRTSLWTELENQSASAGKLLQLNCMKTSGEESINMSFNVPADGEYDLWALAGTGHTNANPPLKYEINGTVYTQSNLAPWTMYTRWDAAGWAQPVGWCSVTQKLELKKGENTLKVIADTNRGDGRFIKCIDSVRLVPSDMQWQPENNLNPPQKRVFEADENGVYLLEAEYAYSPNTGWEAKNEASNGAIIATQNGNGTAIPLRDALFNFTAEQDRYYDVWALVGMNDSNHGSLCNYGVKIDDGEQSLIEVGKTTTQALTGYKATDIKSLYSLNVYGVNVEQNARWVRVRTGEKITAGDHSLTASIIASGNTFGYIDCVAMVPSSYNWIPDGNTKMPEPAMAGYAWIELENAESGMTKTVCEEASNKNVLVADSKTSAEQKTEYEFILANSGKYDIYYLGSDLTNANASQISWQIGDESGIFEAIKRSPAMYSISDTEIKWQKVASEKTISDGTHILKLNIQQSADGQNAICDSIVIVPSSWDFEMPLSAQLPAKTAVNLDAAEKAAYLKALYGDGAVENLDEISVRGSAGSVFEYIQSDDGKTINFTAEKQLTENGYLYKSDAAGTETKRMIASVKNLSAKYSDGSLAVGELTPGETLTVSADVKLATADYPSDALLCAALYENGTLKDIKESFLTLTEVYQPISVQMNVPADVKEKQYKIKAFMWNSYDEMIPLMQTYDTELPAYEKGEMSKLVSRYNRKNISGFNIALIADAQSDSLTGYNTYLHHYRSVANSADVLPIDCIADLGDMIMGSFSNKEATMSLLSKQTEVLAEKRLPVFRIKGNHDDNRWGVQINSDSSLFINDSEWTKSCSADWKNTMSGSTAGEKQYYYRDFPEDKIRVIALDTQNIPYDPETLKSGYTFGFEEEQLEWLAKEALDFSGKSDKGEWGVVFLMHALAYDNGSNVLNFGGFAAITAAFKNGTSGNYSSDTEPAKVNGVNYDFTNQGAMEIICILNGHTHCDGDGTMYGIKYVTTACSLPDSSDCKLDRTIGTENEDLWDIITIDRNNKKIYTTRFGAGDDRELSY